MFIIHCLTTSFISKRFISRFRFFIVFHLIKRLLYLLHLNIVSQIRQFLQPFLNIIFLTDHIQYLVGFQLNFRSCFIWVGSDGGRATEQTLILIIFDIHGATNSPWAYTIICIGLLKHFLLQIKKLFWMISFLFQIFHFKSN